MTAKLERFRLDSKGVAAMLKSGAVSSMCTSVAGRVAASVKGERPEADVVVDSYTTDRAAASVTIRDRSGKLWQVRDGILTRAAAAEGAEVTER